MTALAPAPSQHLRGVLIVVTAALCLVPDATLVRLADVGDARIVFWRAICVAFALSVFLGARYGPRTGQAFGAIGRTGLWVGAIWGIGLALFVYSVNHTAVANTLVILATAPLFAALFTRLFIGELIRRRTWIAMLVAFAGVALTFASALRGGGLEGNIAAALLAMAVGSNLTLIRRAGHVDMLPALAIAGLVAAAVSLPAAWPLAISQTDAVVIGAMGLVLLPAALTLVTVGTRYLPSPEVSLLMMLETVLGPLLAWAVIDEAPPRWAVLGAVLVIGAIAGNSLVALREWRRGIADPADL